MVNQDSGHAGNGSFKMEIASKHELKDIIALRLAGPEDLALLPAHVAAFLGEHFSAQG